MAGSAEDNVPQFAGDGPTVLVKNTFLDFDMAVALPDLRRSKSAPDPYKDDSSSDEQPEPPQADAARADDEGDDDAPPPPMADGLTRIVTEENWEDSSRWQWQHQEMQQQPQQLQQPVSPMQPLVMVPVVMLPMQIPMPASFAGAWADAVDVSMTAPEPPLPPAPQPPALTRELSMNTHIFRVNWAVDGRKLRTNDRNTVSPRFELSMGDRHPAIVFRMSLNAKTVSDSRGGAGFKKAKGTGTVQLKCEATLTEGLHPVTFRIALGVAGSEAREVRGPVTHDFSTNSIANLSAEQEEWNFKAFADAENNGYFVVCLEVVPMSATTCSGKNCS